MAETPADAGGCAHYMAGNTGEMGGTRGGKITLFKRINIHVRISEFRLFWDLAKLERMLSYEYSILMCILCWDFLIAT